MVTFTRSSSSPGGGAWLLVGVALEGEMVRGEEARGRTKVGPGREAPSQISKGAAGLVLDVQENTIFDLVLPPPASPVCPSDAPTISSSGKLMFSLDWLCCLDVTKGGETVSVVRRFTEHRNQPNVFVIAAQILTNQTAYRAALADQTRKINARSLMMLTELGCFIPTYEDCCGGCV